MYDFAHSGYPSAAGPLWVPTMLWLLASRHACPYETEPEFDPSSVDWNPFDGNLNRTEDFCTYNPSLFGADFLNDGAAYTDCTTCKLDSSAIDGYGAWMEAGNSYYGLKQVRRWSTTRWISSFSSYTLRLSYALPSPQYPAHIRKDEGFLTNVEAEKEEMARMLIDNNYLIFPDHSNQITCSPPTGVTSVSPIYNATIYTSGTGKTIIAKGEGTANEVLAQGTYGTVEISFSTTQSSGSPLTIER